MALSFDGNSSKVVIDTTGAIDNTDPYAINFKIQLTDLTAPYNRCISYREGSRGFMVVQEDDKLFIIANGTSATTWGRTADTNSVIVLLGLSTATWYNVSVNFTGGADGVISVPSVWLDGVSVTENGTGSLNGGSGPGYGSGSDTDTVHLGSRSASGSSISSASDCILAEYTMWADHALDGTDATSLAANVSGSTIDAANLAIHYQGLDNTDTTETVNSQTVTFYNTVISATHPTMASANDIEATASMSFGSSASLTDNITQDITATASLSFATSADLTQPITAIDFGSDNFDSAIFDVASSSIVDAATLTPEITFVPEDYGEVGGWLMLCARVSEASGKTPVFKYDSTDNRARPYEAANPCWKYLTDARDEWKTFDNVAIDGSNIVTVSMNTAFTADVEFASKPRWHYSDTQDWFAEIALDSNAHELASSVAATGLPANVHATVDPGATNANTFPEQLLNLYGIRISNDAATPSLGDKWPIVLLKGAHSSEDQGDYMLQYLVDYLLSGTALAGELLRDYDWYIYDVNPSGRAYGKERSHEGDGNNTDLNRAWDGSPSGTPVEDIITAIGTDLSGSLKALIDFHGAYSLSSTEFGAYYNASTNNTLFKDKMAAKLTSGYGYLGTSPVGSSAEWADSEGALVGITHEGAYLPAGYPDFDLMFEDQALGIAETLSEIRGAGDDISAISSLSFGSSAGLNATGKLSGVSSLSFGSGAALNATGALSGVSSISFDSSAGLNATGSLQSTGSMSFGSTAELNAIGSLIASSSITFGTGAELTQEGNFNLTSTAALSFGSVAGLSATGKLTANTGLSFTSSAIANATGGLSAVSSIAFGSAAELTQASLNDIFATAGMAFGSVATITAVANLTATAPLTLSTNALLTVPGVAPTAPGLEYTMSGSQIHFTISGDPLHYTIN